MDSENELVCFCYPLTRAELRAEIRAGARDLKKIQDRTLATFGCGGCEGDVLAVLEEELRSLPPISRG